MHQTHKKIFKNLFFLFSREFATKDQLEVLFLLRFSTVRDDDQNKTEVKHEVEVENKPPTAAERMLLLRNVNDGKTERKRKKKWKNE